MVKKKYESDLCNSKMTYRECELAILRNAVDESDAIKKDKLVRSDDIDKIIKILEKFLSRKKLICYGGTAINNILPPSAQFYDRDIDIPDYDFYSPNALSDAKELADLYYKEGYKEIEAKSGVHYGTFKVYVNFIPIADVTYLEREIFYNLKEEAVVIDGIYYCPPNFLRMNMYLELSRPMGDTSRWEKILKRLILLSQHYPLKFKKGCTEKEYQRNIDSVIKSKSNIFTEVKDILVKQNVVFFGGFATSLYSKYMDTTNKVIEKVPDFDVLCEEPILNAERLKRELEIPNISIEKIKQIGEIIPEHVIFRINNVPVVFFYKPMACHSYNILKMGKSDIKVATIDTILTFYFAFMYTDLPYYNKDRLLCMAKLLFDVEAKNRLSQKGILKRFSIDCFGHQPTLEEIRTIKSEKFKELKDKMGSKEYDMWFLKYIPTSSKIKSKKYKNKKPKTKRKGKKRNRTKKVFGFLY
tara:strand:- start:622 stop:2031 length:1410 start_codon:yes stop_codon:yes gene_type:complete